MRGWVVALISVLPFLAFSAAQCPIAASAQQGPPQPVGQAEPAPPGSSDIGPTAPNTSLQLDVVLQPRDPAALSNFIAQIYNPSSPEYGQYLAPGQFGPEFGATQSTVQQVSSTLSSSGLRMGQVSSNDLTLPVSTTVSGAESAFHIQIDQYREASGRVAFANTSPPQVPASIAPDITDVIGLSDLFQAVPASAGSPGGSSTPGSTAPKLLPAAGGPLPCAAASSIGSLTANQLAQAYGMNTGAYSIGHLGAGETVAIFELEPFASSDISAYKACYGISTTVNTINVDGGPGSGFGSGESALDIEDVAGLAPKATIDVYQAPNTFTGLYDAYQQIATDDTAQSVSTSWGLCEPDEGQSEAQSEDVLFQQMATQRQSVLAAAGDWGSTGCSTWTGGNPTLAVWGAGADPYVTAVGGTYLSAIGPPPSESIWNQSGTDQGAGGGGLSRFWQMPTWQLALGVNSNSSAAPCGAPSGGYCREVPDVSADGAPGSAYAIYHDNSWSGWFGTSAAAPLWAAFVALADENCSNRAGFLNPALYSNATDFNDVTRGGNNDYSPSGYSGDLYPASAGYDMVFGLGTPGSALLTPGVLCSGPAPNGSGTMTVSPTSVAVSSTGDSLVFTYMAASGGTSNGEITIAVPSGWSAPSTTASAGGYVTSTCGNVTIATRTIQITGVDLNSGGSCTTTYGDKSGGGPGAKAPTSSGTSTFTTKEKSTPTGTLTVLASSPKLTVNAVSPSGSGTMTVNPTAVAVSSTGDSLVFTYTAASGGTSNGEITIAVPSGWSAPSTTASAGGYVTSTCGNVTIATRTIQITGVDLNSGGSCTTTYGDKSGGGPGAKAPTSSGASTFTTKEKSTPTGTLTLLSSSPKVAV